MTLFSKRSEAGIAHLAILIAAIIVIGAALVVFLLVRSNDDVSKSGDSSQASNSSNLQVAQRNTARKNDASKLLFATTEYINNNLGQMPTTYANNVLSGNAVDSNSVAVQFDFLESVSITSGAQPAVINPGSMRLVTRAACGENGQTVSGSSRSYAVQFALEKVNGGYTSTCQEG